MVAKLHPVVIALSFILINVACNTPEEGRCDATDGSCKELGADAQDVWGVGKNNVSAVTDGMQLDLNATVQEPPRIEISKASLASRVALVVFMLGAILVWIGAVIKFAIDGSLPARLALWGLVPEVCSAVSVRSLIQLLRLKTEPTPAIVLRNCVDDKGAEKLADAMREYGKKSSLEVVELPHNPALTEVGLRTITAAALHESCLLQEIDVSYNPQFGDATVAAFLPLLESKSSNLNVLKIADCGITPQGLAGLAESVTKSKLRTLDLARNDLKGTGELLATVLEAPVLDEIVIACCGLTTADVREVAEQLPFTGIKSIQLGGNGLGAEGLAALCEHLPRCVVEEIGLEYNEIEDKDLSILGTAWAKRPFGRVNLKGNRMSQEQINKFIRTLKSMLP